MATTPRVVASVTRSPAQDTFSLSPSLDVCAYAGVYVRGGGGGGGGGDGGGGGSDGGDSGNGDSGDWGWRWRRLAAVNVAPVAGALAMATPRRPRPQQPPTSFDITIVLAYGFYLDVRSICEAPLRWMLWLAR